MAADQAFGFACRFEIAQAGKSLKLTSLRRLPQLNACKAKSPERSAQRLPRSERETRAGTVSCASPGCAKAASYFRGFLEPRRMTEKALTAVVQEAFVQGVSTRSVDDLAQVMA